MSAWGTQDMSSALPDAASEVADAPAADVPKNPQEFGWVAKTSYDYETYNKSSKELAEAQTSAEGLGVGGLGNSDDAVGGIAPGDWANNAATYQWDDEYGDIGPEFPELERQLFGLQNHVRTGINFAGIANIEVVQEGAVRIKPIKKFAEAGLHPAMLKNVELAGYNTPTPIQSYTIPSVIEGHDLVACAQTGSGKTAAFLIPILSKLMGKAKKLCAPRPNPATFQAGLTAGVRSEPLVVIVCPTRELATQVFDEARRFCYRTMLRPCVVYGGGPLAEQIAQLQKGCDVLIGTPGRLCDFINRPHLLTLKRLRYMVIDEADEMLDSSWEQELKQIMSGGDQEEGNIKYLMFSATFPKMARELATQHLSHAHVRIRVGRAGSTHMNIRQNVVFVDAHQKRKALFDLLMSIPPARTIIFVNSKRTADEVDDFLFNADIPCTSIHSDRTQKEREDSLRAFRQGKAPVLIATGVSSRGLDIHNVLHVVNYDMPSSQYGGIQEYIHRIGRTGRIGNMGLATSFYNDRDSDIGEMLVKTLLETQQPIPDFLEQYIPEGFTATGDGQGTVTGNIADLIFENDSDDGEENGEDTEAPAQATPAWGATTDAPAQAATPAWGATTHAPAQTAAPAWNIVPEAAAPPSVFGQPADQFAPPPVHGGQHAAPVPVPTFAAQPPTQSTWGVPVSSPPQGQYAPPPPAPQYAPPTQYAGPPQGAPPANWAAPSGPPQYRQPANGGWSASAPAAVPQPQQPANNGWDTPSAQQQAPANGGW